MENKFIHLLYVPTMACNMGCKYCYLEDNTKDNSLEYDALDTLKFAIKKFKDSNVNFDDIPNNSGGIIDINNQKVGIYKDTSRKYLCC